MSCNQLQVKVIAIVEMVMSVLLLILMTFFTVVVFSKRDAMQTVLERHPEDYPHLVQLFQASTLEQVSLFMLPIAYFLVELVLGILLYHGAQKLQYKRLRLWMTVTVTLTAVGILFFFAELLRNQGFADTVTLYLANLAFTLYSIWAVFRLMSEIKAGSVHHPVPYSNGFYKL